ncbi:MAG: hypothetical protein KF778_20680 [Rhodocyclaceae bacterium]|nr:hypothetical protein [Rhodocyclaceae bacterium]
MIFTFYSFKGGVGRSMAMANIGDCLARRGLRVLMIDFDLEAPGLERYFKRLDVAAALRNPGVMDLISAFKRAMASGEDLSRAEFHQIERYLFPVYPDQGGSRLDLMTAGRRAPDDELRRYALAVRTFEWQDFYFNWEGEAFFEWMRKTLAGPQGMYDVVLADSRTGVTEMGGICAYQLADVVVMMTAANRQNIEGTRRVADDFRSPQVLGLRRGRPLQLLVVPARIEQRADTPEARRARDDFGTRFEDAFGAMLPPALAELGLDYGHLALPYEPEYAFEERVSGSDADTAAQHDEFDTRLLRLADVLTVLADHGELAEQRDDAIERLRTALAAEPAAPFAAAAAPADLDLFSAAAGAGTLEPTRTLTGASSESLDDLWARLERGEIPATPATPPPPPSKQAPQPARASAAPVAAYDRSQRFAGYDAFISNSRAGRADAERLGEALEREHLQARLSEAAEYGAENEVPQTTSTILHHTHSLLVCAGPDGLSGWQKGEIAAARRLPTPPRIVPILLPGADPDIFALGLSGLGDTQVFDLREWPQKPDGFRLLVDLLRGTAASPDTERTVVDTTRCPYPGSKAFDESDAAFFLGRKAEVHALADALAARHWLVLKGNSGVGKTSLVRAGLFPRLRTGLIPGSADWRLEYLDLAAPDGTDRLDILARAPAGGLLCIDHVDGLLHDDATVSALETLIAAAEAGNQHLLIVWRAAPLALIATACRSAWQRGHAAALRNPRHELYNGLPALVLPNIWKRLNGEGVSFELGPMAESERKAMVEKSAARAGRALEPGLADRLLKDACQPEFQLPLLALALSHLWQRQVRGFLRNEDYERAGTRADGTSMSGGMESLFVDQLAKACAELDGAALEAARALMLRLVEQNVAGELENRALDWVQAASAPVLVSEGAKIADRLARVGVLRIANSGKSIQLDLAYRLAAGAWRRFHEWRTSAAWASDAQILLYYLDLWLKSERADSALLYVDYPSLQAAVQRGMAQNPQVYSELQRVYVERSVQIRQARRRMRMGMITTLAFLAGLAGVGWWRGHVAQTQTMDVERIARQTQQIAAEKDSDAAIARSNLSYAAAKAEELDAALKTNDQSRVQQALGALRDIASKSAVASTVGATGPARDQRIYLHIQREEDRNPARRLAARLAREGYAVQGIQVVGGKTNGDVRFRKEDEREAERVIGLTERWLTERGTRMQIAPMDISANPRAQQGVIEIWLPPLPPAPKLDDRGQFSGPQP